MIKNVFFPTGKDILQLSKLSAKKSKKKIHIVHSVITQVGRGGVKNETLIFVTLGGDGQNWCYIILDGPIMRIIRT